MRNRYPTAPHHRRKPEWLRVRMPSSREYRRVKSLLRVYGLHTVCEEAYCPNISECWGAGTATFLLLGDVCTRACRFCDVKKGNPRGYINPSEPRQVAEACRRLGLRYVVLTSVDRDDLVDGGAHHFAEAVRAVKGIGGGVVVEALIPDFQGDLDALRVVVEASPDVIGHNLETTLSLTPRIRDRRAGYHQSLQVLRNVKKLDPTIYTKSSLMLGLGETEEEVVRAMWDLRMVEVDLLTLGQYLQPSRRHPPVDRYVTPREFEHLKRLGEEMGFLSVASGPLVRSSYRAGELLLHSVIRGGGV